MLIEISKSNLVNQVYLKSSPKDFPQEYRYFAKLNDFADHVIPQLTQINLLFDEYTPHDEIHMNSLFRIADRLLGDRIVDFLNCAEACILACSIYGHDWGMAVSKDEKTIITTGKPPFGRDLREFALLPNESYSWTKYAKSKNIEVCENGFVDNELLVSKEQWREYVRITHSERSRAKVEHFFKGNDKRLGELIGEVSAGHWYDTTKISQLEKDVVAYDKLINLRALVTYMRFIDLMDVGANRTPFSLWKFLQPKNIFSNNEWEKHMALQPVHFEHEDGPSLIIRIQGNTTCHKVYASLIDMRSWISSQVEENYQILKELGDYSLGHVKLNWKVEAVGFEPIDVRFEFDRSKMFDLISGEIYNGDPYVFLRELLQNSIDSTKVRELQYLNKGMTIDFDKLAIKIDVSHDKNGDAELKFTDSGVGMSIDVIRNYLSVIGRSYYRSDEYRDLALGMNPISRFGVGLISCFEVADTISIRTQTDSILVDDSDAFNIEIENYNQQFRVEKISNDISQNGTAITINILGKKWKKGKFKESEHLNVSEYVKSVAGFVPFPIVITENGKGTLILPADIDSKTANYLKEKFVNKEIWKERLKLSLKEVISPKDLGFAESIFEERIANISRKIDGLHFSGAISYFLPLNGLIGIRRDVTGSSYGVTAFVSVDSMLKAHPVRWLPNGPNAGVDGFSESAKKSNFKRLYLNGILISNLKDSYIDFKSDYMPPSRITINIKPSIERDVVTTLSRQEIKDVESVLPDIIDCVLKDEFDKIIDDFTGALNASDLFNRMFLLGRIQLYFPNARKYLKNSYPIEKWPMPFINVGGSIQVIKVEDLPDEIEVLPIKYFKDRKLIDYGWHLRSYLDRVYSDVDEFFKSEDGKLFIIDFGFEFDDGSAMEWNAINQFLQYSILSERFVLKGLRVQELNNEKYIIENWEKGRKPEKGVANINMYHFKFLPFDLNSNNIFCLLPLANDQLSKNRASDIVFNTNHAAVKILQKVLKEYNEKEPLLDSVKREVLRVEFATNPLVGYGMENYSGNRLQSDINKWCESFCVAIEENGLITLSEEERSILRSDLEIHTCFK